MDPCVLTVGGETGDDLIVGGEEGEEDGEPTVNMDPFLDRDEDWFGLSRLWDVLWRCLGGELERDRIDEQKTVTTNWYCKFSLQHTSEILTCIWEKQAQTSRLELLYQGHPLKFITENY